MSTLTLTADKFAAAAERLPTTPQIFSRLNAVIKDPDVSVEEIVSIVRLDASLSARVLRLSNSPHFARGETISSLGDAINRTGFQEIYRLVGAAMSSQLYITGLPVYGIGGDELWNNSLTTAVALEQLCYNIGEDPKLGYTLGLLRPVGRLLLQRLAMTALIAPLSGRKATAGQVHEWEMATFGLTSAEAAGKLFALWGFPAELSIPVKYQFTPLQAEDGNRFGALLHVASWITNNLGKGLVVEKDAWDLSPEILELAGIPREVAEICVEKTNSAADELTSVMQAVAA